MKFSIFMIFWFEVIWTDLRKDILKLIGMVLMLNVSSKNIIKHFKSNLCLYCFLEYFVTPGSIKIVNSYYWQANTWLNYILRSILIN